MSEKPTYIPTWADDENYAAGAYSWSATPTKVRPSSTVRNKGWRPTYPPAAQYLNHLLHDLCVALQNVTGLRLSNWFGHHSVAAITDGGDVASGCYDESTGRMTSVFTVTANYPQSIESHDGGMAWADSTDHDISNTTDEVNDIDSDGDGTRVVLLGFTTDQAYYSTGGAWTKITGLTAVEFTTVAGARGQGAGDAAFMMGGASGKVMVSADGITWTDESPAGISSEPIRCIAHTRDAANPYWCAITDTYAAITTDDGSTWTVNAHGLSGVLPNPKTLFYDVATTKWVLVLEEDNLAFSTEGKAWTTQSEILPYPPVAAVAHITGDGKGELCITAASTTDGLVIFGSTDGGVTWFQADAPGRPVVDLDGPHALIYGKGRFAILYYDSGFYGLYSLGSMGELATGV